MSDEEEGEERVWRDRGGRMYERKRQSCAGAVWQCVRCRYGGKERDRVQLQNNADDGREGGDLNLEARNEKARKGSPSFMLAEPLEVHYVCGGGAIRGAEGC